ncbi:MAG: hypothetical protein JXR94_05455 [Candidatus Hydrogenedentes bacterium]|nr:hypothetical protein [Candidatus Hydrogenedentota bacterium]
MTPTCREAAARCILILLFLAGVHCPDASGLSGTIERTGGRPVPYAFVALLSMDFSTLGYASTDASGAFAIEPTAPGDTPATRPGYLAVQPPPTQDEDGLGIYAVQPRLYRLDGADTVHLRLPPVGCLVLTAYAPDGALMRWQDFERNGRFGGQFMFATNLKDQLRPAVAWPVYDAAARDHGSRREQGLPALVVEPAGPYAVQVLFWPTQGYGKLHLRADNAGQGYRIAAEGQGVSIELNVEFARTAIADLERRQPAFGQAAAARIAPVRKALDAACAQPTAPERAASADRVLVDALRLRDALEVEAARTAIPAARSGTLRIRVADKSGNPVPGCRVHVAQQSHAFRFGVFEGSPYNAAAFDAARNAGFEMATVLLGWNWTDARGGRPDVAGIEQVFGISALRRLGYRVKAHGVVWLQEYGILPERAKAMGHAELCAAAIEQARTLTQAFGGAIDLWEALNEPAGTNAVGMPRPMVNALLAGSAHAMKSVPGITTLVNSGHEVDYGTKYLFFGVDNEPASPFPLTYSEALERAAAQDALEHVDVIGIQFYPGFRFNESFGGLQGPAVTPARLVDMVDGYRAFGKPIHITEFSLPSSYGADAFAGYWREPWTEATQADYAEAVFTLCFGNPSVQSVTWWDISDAKPSVISGGLIDKAGHPKPVYERLSGLIRQWSTDAEAETGADGLAEVRPFAGRHRVTATLPGGERLESEVRIEEGGVSHLTLAPEDAS